MNISVFVISVCCGLILLSIISCMMNPLFRMPKGGSSTRSMDNENLSENNEEDNDNEGKEVLPPLSVIISVNDNIDLLERNLPLILDQEYEPGYQVIIVAHEGDSLADDLIKRYKDHDNIQSTFIPKTSFYISREKLGVTLGVKAAKNEWCVAMDATCYPESNQWLKEIGRQCTEDKNIVLGYCNYDNESHVFQRFARLRHFAYLCREAKSWTPYCANNSNMAFRKSEFIKEDGYRGNLECVRGEYDFIINKYARRKNTGIVTSKDGTLTEVAPSNNQWHHRQKFFIHSCKLMGHGFWHKALGFIDALLLHLVWIMSIILGALAIYAHNWFVLASAVLALLISIIWRTVIGRNTAKRMNTEISPWAIVWLELTSMWHTLADRIRYWRADKYDFTCHKL